MGAYRHAHPVNPEQHRVVSDLLLCRTPRLGGHLLRCGHCGAERIVYQSCRNRHCPKCQHIPRERWLQARSNEILPVHYFHIVFTLPHELNPIILQNKTIMLNLLFKAVSRTLLRFGEQQLGGKLGFIAVLHTWDQQLKAHFHLHTLVPAGAACTKTGRWIPSKPNYLFSQKALSVVFRGKFIAAFNRALRRNQIQIRHKYQPLKKNLYKHKWVVSVRDPISQPHYVLQYLARYAYRVGIANSRITALHNGMVSFRYKDRKRHKRKLSTISAVEFIGRFLLHTLPKGFVRIRHYGFLANRDRTANLQRIGRWLKCTPKSALTPSSVQEMMLALTGVDITLCQRCMKGFMHTVAYIHTPPGKHPNSFIRAPDPPLAMA
jgi:hypothetical protein